ncbi:MAG TPA: TonB-dependent receptor, partial [Nevskiaceae bacterium]|nr:TonB-dependent receptor [Nevskiaceae bacterium]
VLRGPYSALYGNSSAGVVQVFSAGGNPPGFYSAFSGGSYGGRRAAYAARGVDGALEYGLSADYFGTDGYRGHSAAQRWIGNGQLRYDFGSGGTLEVLGSSIDLPEAQDPLGLTATQLATDRTQATLPAVQFNTRKRVHQYQGGLVWEKKFSDALSLRVMGYGGHRAIGQVLSTPVAAQTGSPLNSGGVVDLGSVYDGGDARLQYQLGALQLTGGFSYDRQDQHRRGYENFSGAQMGVQGKLRRDEQDDVYNVDEYLQADWRFAQRWSLLAGVRHSEVLFASNDAYIVAGNPDDGGSRNYAATTPVAGLMFRASDALHLYASYGAGFETPTFTEMAYRPDGSAGLNLGLDEARSNNFEIGAKHRADGRSIEAALFEADARNELAVFSNSNGRTTYHNIDRARRRGAELSASQDFSSHWNVSLAYTWVQAQFETAFANCATPASCTINGGTPIPGVPRNDLYTELRWQVASGWHAGINAQALSRVYADDAGTQHAAGYALLGADAGWSAPRHDARLSLYLRGENLTGARYVGSVIVNEANGRYFEPAPGRTFFAGASLRY